jgi:hypothetical protein
MHCNAPSSSREQSCDQFSAIFHAICELHAYLCIRCWGHVAEDIAEPVQIEDGAGNEIPTIFVNSLSTGNYALQCTKYKWRTAEMLSLLYL